MHPAVSPGRVLSRQSQHQAGRSNYSYKHTNSLSREDATPKLPNLMLRAAMLRRRPRAESPQKTHLGYKRVCSFSMMRLSTYRILGTYVTETDQHPSPEPSALLASLAKAQSDTTGTDTFRRYLWQAKQVVRLWLTCLSASENLRFVVCEQVEDIALVYPTRIRFLQLKTRDRGSWSANAMCDRGIDTLARSYISARQVGIHEFSSFELWLEGPISDLESTVDFCANPLDASNAIKAKIIKLGIKRSWLPDFLERLIINPDQPTRAHVDAKAIWEIGAIWTQLSYTEILGIYERLLTAATAAQSASVMPNSIQASLAAAQPYLSLELPDKGQPSYDSIDPIRNQILTQAMIASLAPPLPGENIDHMLARMSAGTAASLLELKMKSAGASANTIQKTKELRAEMEVQRQLLLSSQETAEGDLEHLAKRVLILAEATANTINIGAVANPAAAARPGEAIASDLLSRPADLAQCDRQSLFDCDGQLLYGYIAHLSDLCHFGWRAA